MSNEFDLTGQQIKDTYPRILQINTPSGSIVLDGLGNPVDLVISGNLNVLGIFTAADESANQFFQAIHTGSTNINTISPVSLSWDTQDLTNTAYTHSTAVTSSTEIQVGLSGWYDVSYSVVHSKFGNARSTVQSVIRLNGFTNIDKSLIVSYKRNALDGDATANVWSGFIELSASDFIELILSNAGGNISQEVNTIPESSLLSMRLIQTL